MTSSLDVRTTDGRLRLVALVEALTWVGLLTGMYFKRVSSTPTEIGVQIFGPLHGAAFIAFVIAGIFAGLLYKWSVTTWLLALLGSIVPLGSVIFIIWADRNAKLGEARRSSGATAPAGSLPETS